jgi:excisionase family DNA binding protein
MNNEKLLNIEQTAELLDVTVTTIRKAISEGRLKAFKRFSKWYIFLDDVFDFIRSGECSTDKQNKDFK